MFYYVIVASEALLAHPCDLFVDTIGVASAYVYVKIFFGCKVASYTHYPMISNDMIAQIDQGVQFNNSEAVARSPL